MFDRARAALIVTAAACAAAVLVVFAAGFALYAFALPYVGAAGAAAIVALAAALALGLYALISILNKRKREHDTEVAHAELLDELPLGLGDIARDRPMLTLGIAALSGLLAARHPTLTRDLIHLAARFTTKR
jgi:hypothetical protein